MVAMKIGHFKSKILSAFAAPGYRRTAVVPVLASYYGVPQDRRRVFIFGLRDDLQFEGDYAQAAAALLDEQKANAVVTVREALSDLPREVSADDGPLPYPCKSRNGYSDYQKLMRLDFDQPLLSAQQKRRRLQKDELFNHHTKGIEERRKAILVAIKPGARGDSLPKELWNGTRGHKWRRLDPDKPSYTILAQMHRDLSEWIHPKHDRWITVREADLEDNVRAADILLTAEDLAEIDRVVPPGAASPPIPVPRHSIVILVVKPNRTERVAANHDRRSQVRSRLAGGGGSHERTRLWTPGFPASWENTGNFLRRASTLHHIAIKRRVVSSTCWPIP
jgi:DNA (cytosine-5)-methyltransferase 1